MFRILTKRTILRIWAQGYEAGMARGYELGWQMRKIDQHNRGFIIGNRINIEQEIETILRGKEF